MNRKERRANESMARKQKKRVDRADRHIYNERGPGRASHTSDISSNGAWDSLYDLRGKCLSMLASTARVNQLVRDRDLLERTLSNPREFLDQYRTLANDVNLYKQRLDAITAKHQGKAGDAELGDELAAALNISQEYIEWIDSFQEVVIPSVDNIMSVLNNVDPNTGEKTADTAQEPEPEQKKVHQGEWLPGNNSRKTHRS